MNYLIDANNLAGAMDILDDPNFDELLIETMENFNTDKQRSIFLVFDGIDNMGDKYNAKNNVVVIRSPRDDHYKTADDKIIEMFHNNECGNEPIIVTDDIELKNSIKKISESMSIKVTLIQATDFAARLKEPNYQNSDKILSQKSKQKINDELLDLWT
jgi:hypothetical protein